MEKRQEGARNWGRTKDMTAWRIGDGRRKSVAIYAFCRDLLWRLALVIVKSRRDERDVVEDRQFLAASRIT